MKKLWFEGVSLDEIEPYVDDLVLEPYIGFQRIEYLQPIEIVFQRFYSSPTPSRRLGDIVAFYIASYHSLLKIGYSSYGNVVGRVFSEAPLVGVIISLVLVKREYNMEKVDNKLCEYAKAVLGNEKSIIVSSRRDKNHLESYVEFLLNDVDKGMDRAYLVEKATKVSEYCWTMLNKFSKYFDVISPPSFFTFATRISDEDIEALRRYVEGSKRVVYGISNIRCREVCKGELVVLQNGICILSVRGFSYIDFCDRFCYNLLLDLVK